MCWICDQICNLPNEHHTKCYCHPLAIGRVDVVEHSIYWSFMLNACSSLFSSLSVFISFGLLALSWHESAKKLKYQLWLNSQRFNICMMSAPSEQFSPTANSEQKPTDDVKEYSMPLWCETQNFIFPLSATLDPQRTSFGSVFITKNCASLLLEPELVMVWPQN